MSDPQFNDEPIAITYSIPPMDEPWGSVHPVTIFQIHQAESSETHPLIMEGRDVGAVTFVAHVISVNISSGALSYTLEDGTGRILGIKDFTSLTHQHGSSAEAEKKEILQSKAFEHTFVEVLATLKRDSKWKSFIKIDAIHPVHDYHQVMYHILNVIQSNMLPQQWIQPDDPDESFRSSEDMMRNMSMDDGQGNPDDISIQCPITCVIPVPHPILPSIFSPQKHHPYAALKSLEKAIMKYMHHHRNHHVLIPELARAIHESCGCTESQFDHAFQTLLSEAYVTSPLDDGYVVVTPRH